MCTRSASCCTSSSRGNRIARRRSEDRSSRLSALAPGIDPQLERAILKAIARDPRDRPATALEMAAALPDIDPRRAATGRQDSRRAAIDGSHVAGRRRDRRRRWSRQLHSSSGPARHSAALTARDTIVLADFLNTTGDPVFDSTLKVALAVALEQSPFLKVFPDERAHEDLLLMQRSPDEAHHPGARAPDCATRTAQGARRGLDRESGPPLCRRPRGGQRRERRRDGARAGRGEQQGRSADRRSGPPSRDCGESSASRSRRSSVRRAAAQGDDALARSAAGVCARAR